ncbi:vWA domain-containing protein [Haloflavibacter putidus]|uniref:VWA domain-containing protein n=1 Tax=Haloflavibacter putidus TaxID=2576776 RepID=A0A507ZXW4_9FLAO|nr:VWA domain-containing protein [Haloflavibacter putidus]TQD40548.1 VWA domain-containing protein [Haloflavibacter putidus]
MLDFNNITFEHPQWFWLFLLLPVLLVWFIVKRHKQTPEVEISSIKGFKVKQGLLPKLRPVLWVLQLLALSLLILAMTRPRTVDVTTQTSTTQGIDIMMAIDVSASMLAKDLEPNRLEALKEVAADFIDGRPNDRFGLVLFAGESFTKIPITSDKSIVKNGLRDINYEEISEIMESGTAIGMGLATSVNRIKDSKAESKVIILLTDGVNNAGVIDPQTAMDLAIEYGIKTYTIGIGTNGMALSPVAIAPNGRIRYRNVQVEIDEALLREISEKTNAQYFRATDTDKLQAIYDEIDKLEKSDIEEFKYYNYDEKYRPLVLLAGLLLIIQVVLRYTIFRSFV